MARVNVEQSALTDPRFLRLGRLLKCPPSLAHEAGLAVMIRVWNHLTENWSEEAGHEAYVIRPEALRDLFAGRAFGSRLGRLITESGLADETEFGFRIRGSYGRIEWLNRRRDAARINGAKGGRKPNSVNPPSPAPSPSPAQKTGERPLLTAPTTRDERAGVLSDWMPIFNTHFWPQYPRKVAKADAQKAWTAIAPTNSGQIEPRARGVLRVLGERKRGEWADRPRDKLPYPATFLRREEFPLVLEVTHATA